jgi:isorenieratene synthase
VEHRDVVVVGAGIAGLAAAIHLAERGVAVTLLEAGSSLGGKLSGNGEVRFRHHGREWLFNSDHGIHAIGDAHLNLAALLSRAGCRERFRQVGSTGILYRRGNTTIAQPLLPHRPGRRAPFRGLATLLTTGNRLLELRPADLPALAAALVELLGFDPGTDDPLEDLETVAEFAARHRLPEELQTLLFASLPAGSSDDPRFVSLASAKSLLASADLAPAGGPRLELLRGGTDENLVRPLAGYARDLGVRILRGARVVRLLRESGRIAGVRVVESGAPVGTVPPYAPDDVFRAEAELPADAVILAVDVPSLKHLLDRDLVEEPFFSRLRRLEAIDGLVARVFTDRPLRPGRADAGILAGGFLAVDRWFVLSRLQDESRTYRRVTGGDVIAVSGHRSRYELARLSPEETRARVIEDVVRAFPELEGGIVHLAIGRTPATLTRQQARSLERRATSRTPVPGLYLAGDHVRCLVPAFGLERAAVTGIEAANEVLAARGLRQDPPLRRERDVVSIRLLRAARWLGIRVAGPPQRPATITRRPRAPDERPPRVLVVGSGLAGLSAAASLAERGLDVTVAEKDDVAGGRLRALPPVRLHQGGRLWAFPSDLGAVALRPAHANLRDLLRRVAASPTLVPGGPLDLIFAGPGSFEVQRQRLFERALPLPAPLHALLDFVPRAPLFRPTRRDLASFAGLFVELGGHVELRDEEFDDRETVAAMRLRYSLRDETAALLTALSGEGEIDRPERVSAASLKNRVFRYALASRDAGTVEWIAEGGPAIVEPLLNFIADHGAQVLKGVEVVRLVTSPDGAVEKVVLRRHGREEEASFDHVILALDAPALQRLLVASGLDGDSRLAPVLRLRSVDPAILRMWFAGARLAPTRATRGVCTGDFALADSYVVLSRIRPDCRDWAEATGGEVIELRIARERERARGSTGASFRVEAENDLARIFPELAGKLVHLDLQECPPSFAARDVGHIVDAPRTETPIDNLYLAGEFVRVDLPVHDLERSVVSGRQAANEILRREGYPAEAILPETPPTPIHRWLAALRERGFSIPKHPPVPRVQVPAEVPAFDAEEPADTAAGA